ncbi:DUF4390 domain-containing protein [Ferrigenium sp. UT5]
MPCCAKNSDRWWRWLALGILLIFARSTFAAGISIDTAEARLTSAGYVLSADFNIQLAPQVEDALRHNVTLYFVGELSLHRSRWYWPDAEIAMYRQTSKLSFNALTGQYRISRGGLYQSFATLEDALRAIGHISTLPIEPAELSNAGGGRFSRWFKKGSRIDAAAALSLDVSQLPKPLQINAMTSEQWDVKSETFQWEIKASTSAEERAP